MRRRRRTRYRAEVVVVRTEQVKELDILEYSKQAAIDLANRRGFKVLRIDTAANWVAGVAGRNQLWKIDQAALREAAEFLGLKRPVKIRFNSRVGHVNGRYTNHGIYHDIMLKSYLSIEQASRTLWHELAHAMQYERDGLAAVRAAQYRPGSSRRINYAVRPIEVEAREFEQYAEACPLVVAR